MRDLHMPATSIEIPLLYFTEPSGRRVYLHLAPYVRILLSWQAFPVLSRILTENHLLNTSVGALVISAASVDEACVWCLLALVVSTVNAGSPLDAFYVFLLLVFFLICMLTGE